MYKNLLNHWNHLSAEYDTNVQLLQDLDPNHDSLLNKKPFLKVKENPTLLNIDNLTLNKTTLSNDINSQLKAIE